jgi:hypothetical protein
LLFWLAATNVEQNWSNRMMQHMAGVAGSRRKRILAAVVVTLFSLTGCGQPSQVANDPECFQAVDALWTAVTSKRADLLEQTASELDRLHAGGKLSDSGYRELSDIVEKARSSEWTTSAKMLKTFMLGQRKSHSA